MALKYLTALLLFISFNNNVQSVSLIEVSYNYIWSLGKSLAPNFMNMFDCIDEDDAWECARDKAGKMLDSWKGEVDKQRRDWQTAADNEARSSGRSYTEMPSKLGMEVESALTSLADLVQHGLARALSRRKENNIDRTTNMISGDERNNIRGKKQRAPKVPPLAPWSVTAKAGQRKGRGFQNYGEQSVQSWVIGDSKSMSRKYLTDENSTGLTEKTGNGEVTASNGKPRGILHELWSVGEQGVDALAEHLVEAENAENGISNAKAEEQRGKKKKKKILLLKLLTLGAVLKAKIATILQILSYKLQVKFFLVALIGLGINLARFWLELKNKHHQQPQKIIYYEHAQHQHHYDHEEEEAGWGPWARTIHPQEAIEENDEAEVEFPASPYRAYEKIAQAYGRPTLTRG